MARPRPPRDPVRLTGQSPRVFHITEPDLLFVNGHPYYLTSLSDKCSHCRLACFEVSGTTRNSMRFGHEKKRPSGAAGKEDRSDLPLTPYDQGPWLIMRMHGMHKTPSAADVIMSRLVRPVTRGPA